MKRYYGFDNVMGIGMRYAEDSGRYGQVVVFDTKAERDDWIERDEFDGRWHREAITSTQARREMLRCIDCQEVFHEPASFMERHGSMDEIVDAYLDM